MKLFKKQANFVLPMVSCFHALAVYFGSLSNSSHVFHIL